MKTSVKRVTYFRASVVVPDSVWDGIIRHSLEKQWDSEVQAQAFGSLGSGQDSYAKVEEWAHFANEAWAQNWVASMCGVVHEMQRRIDKLDKEDR